MTTKNSVTPSTKDRYMVLVLGMHRSGTSALTGVLNHLGCQVPKELMSASEYNPKGHFEGSAFFKFNETLLKSAGSAWNDWGPVRDSWLASPIGQSMVPRAQALLEQEFGKSPLVVLKDPRICRMVPIWLKAADLTGFEVFPILTHRNPLEVAKSLHDRDGIEVAEGLLIWLRHVLEAEHATRGLTRVIINYNQVLDNWPGQVSRIQKKFKFTFPNFDTETSENIEKFLTPTLRHHSEAPEKVLENEILSTWIRDTYEILERWVGKKESKSDYPVLDRVRAELDIATPVFSQLVGPKSNVAQSLKYSAARVKAVEAEAAAKTKSLEDAANARVQKAQADADAKARELEDAAAAKLKAAERQKDKLLSEGKSVEAALKKDLSKRQVEMQTLQTALDDLTIQIKSRDEKVTASEAEQARLVAEAEAYKALIAERDTQIARDADAHRNLKAVMIAQRADANGKIAQYAKAQAALDAQEESMAALKVEMADLNGKLLETKSALAQRSLEADETFDRAKKAEAALLQQTEDARKADAKRVEEIAEMTRFLAQSRQLLDQKTAETEFLTTELEALRNSTFWRITKPMRAVIDTLRPRR